MDWELYGWISFSHRRAVILALDRPRQPSEIKRRARYLNPRIRMSANNVRDIIRELRTRDLVRTHEGPGHHPQYALTAKGLALQQQLWQGEAR